MLARMIGLLLVLCLNAAPALCGESAEEAAARAEMANDAVPVGEVVHDGKLPSGGLAVFADELAAALKTAMPARAGQIKADGGGVVLVADKKKTSFSLPSLLDIAQGDICYWDIVLQAPEKTAGQEGLSGRILADGLLWPISFALKPGETRRFVHHAPAWQASKAGAVSLVFEMAEAGSELKITGFTFLSYGKKVREGELPYRREDYAGRSPDAAWRKAAAERIQKYRTSAVRVAVLDKSGKTVSGAEVKIDMLRHDFPFGTAVGGNWLDLSNNTANAVRYRAELVRLFNAAGMENLYKWRSWDDPANRKRALSWTDWLQENGLRLRGHVMVWPSWSKSPAGIKTEYEKIKKDGNRAAADKWLAEAIRRHIRDIGSTLNGKIYSWDVINETAANRDYMQILGEPVMADWFRVAHEAAPEAQLVIVENSLLTGRKIDYFMRHAKLIKDAGAPIGGLGAQGHIGIMEPEKILTSLDQLATLGLPISITEFDVKSVDKNLQGEMFRDALTAFFSHPSVNGVLTWGFWDGQHWLTDAPFFYRDWTPKPALREYEELVFHKWWTHVSGKTDSAGIFSDRCFHGKHKVVVQYNGRTTQIEVLLPAPEPAITVTVE